MQGITSGLIICANRVFRLCKEMLGVALQQVMTDQITLLTRQSPNVFIANLDFAALEQRFGEVCGTSVSPSLSVAGSQECDLSLGFIWVSEG